MGGGQVDEDRWLLGPVRCKNTELELVVLVGNDFWIHEKENPAFAEGGDEFKPSHQVGDGDHSAENEDMAQNMDVVGGVRTYLDPFSTRATCAWRATIGVKSSRPLDRVMHQAERAR